MNRKKRDVSRVIKTSTVVLIAGAVAAVFVSKNAAPLKNAVVTSIPSTVAEYSQSAPAESGSPDSTDISPPEKTIIDINTATSEELQTLPGIGEAKAQAIIAYREEHGAFSSVDELTNVGGIGAKTLEAFRDRITASGQSGAAPHSTPSVSPEKTIIDINTATSDELQALPGIGEAKAQAIIAYREEHGAFSSVDELTNVGGIGAKTLEAFRDRITASGQSGAAPHSTPSVSPEKTIIDINTATSEELQTLPGIGEAKAQAIIAYREEHGAFSSADELTNVGGIGAKTLEKFREKITV